MFLFYEEKENLCHNNLAVDNDTFAYLVTLHNRVTSTCNNRDISLDVTVRQDVEKRLLSGTKPKDK